MTRGLVLPLRIIPVKSLILKKSCPVVEPHSVTVIVTEPLMIASVRMRPTDKALPSVPDSFSRG